MLMENLTERKVKTRRSDNGGECTSIEFQQFCIEHGIKRELTVPMTPEQNGKAERMNRTIIESTRAKMLHHAKMPLKFWAEALSTAVYLRNRSPTTALDGITPYECFHGEKPDVSNLKVFGCRAFVHVPKEKRSKLEGKSINCIFVGYPSTSKGFKFYDVENDKMFVSRDAKFLENDFLHDNSRNSQHFLDLPTVITEESKSEMEYENGEDHETHNEEFEDQAATRKSTGKRIAPERFGTITGNSRENEDIDCSIATLDSNEPTDIKEAFNGINALRWKEAIENEYDSLIQNKTWDLVDAPADKNIIGCKWGFKVKRNADGSINRYKARLVAQGYSQEAGVDYDEIYAPVARYNSIRTVLAIANALDFELHQMDIKTAFLNGKLDQEIYMAQPDAFVQEEHPNKVCKLNRSIYGLKQSARCWNLEIDSYLKSFGYVQSNADSSIYTKSQRRNKENKTSMMIIALYVDDIMLATNDPDMLKAKKMAFPSRFDMEDQGEAHFCLGMQITRDRNKILCISQKAYLENILKRFGMYDCRSVTTPLESGKNYTKLPGDKGTGIKKYQAAIGSLNYAAIATRPDLSTAIGKLSQFMSNPSQEHWQGVKREFRYLKGTLNYCLKYDGNMKDLTLNGYVDADWCGDTETRRSTSGYIFQVAGCTISWRSKRQAIVALSSTEAEYIATSFATQEAIWLKRLLESLKVEQPKPTKLFKNNQGAIVLSKNPSNHSRTKHKDLKFHFIPEAIQRKQIDVEYCESNKMPADILTKGLEKERFEKLRCLIGV